MATPWLLTPLLVVLALADGRSRHRRSAFLLLERLEQHLAGLAGFGLVSSELELANRLARRRTDRPVGGAAIKAEIAQENLNGLGLVRSVGGPGADVDRARGLLLLGPFRRRGRRAALARLALRPCGRRRFRLARRRRLGRRRARRQPQPPGGRHRLPPSRP